MMKWGVDQATRAMRDEEMLAEIEDFLEGFNQPTYPRNGKSFHWPAGSSALTSSSISAIEACGSMGGSGADVFEPNTLMCRGGLNRYRRPNNAQKLQGGTGIAKAIKLTPALARRR